MGNHQTPIWVLRPLASPHFVGNPEHSMGPIRASPHLTHTWATHKKLTWDPCGPAHIRPTYEQPTNTQCRTQVGQPTLDPHMGNPQTPHVGPRWASPHRPTYGQPTNTPCGTQVGQPTLDPHMGNPQTPHVGPRWASPH